MLYEGERGRQHAPAMLSKPAAVPSGHFGSGMAKTASAGRPSQVENRASTTLWSGSSRPMQGRFDVRFGQLRFS